MHVVYGMVGLKTHSKVVLVVRDDGDRLRRYCHIGTGNYNSKTARIYEDLGILTCDNDIGADAAQLFNHLTGYSRTDEYQTLLVAPARPARQLIDLIEHEASFGADGRITLKCNCDRRRRDHRGAVRRERGRRAESTAWCAACACLRAGVPGLSENIRVRSVLGRYLEHSRIYRFAHGNVRRPVGEPDGPMYLIGSADLMPRNLDRRVEVLVPIEHPQAPRVARPGARVRARRRRGARGSSSPTTAGNGSGRSTRFEPHAQERMYRWTVEQQLAGRVADCTDGRIGLNGPVCRPDWPLFTSRSCRSRVGGSSCAPYGSIVERNHSVRHP